MLPGVVLGWSHRKRESNQTPERALQIGRNVADGSRVTRFGISRSGTMRANDGTRTGGEILIDQLAIHGVHNVFCVPGDSYLAALDAFHDSEIVLTVCRHESSAAMMAEA